MPPDSPYQPPSSLEPPPIQQPGADTGLTVREILFSFRGRIPRSIFWMWALITVVSFIIPISLLVPLLDRGGVGQVIGITLLIPLVIAFVWISLAIRVKRWHDHGKSGMWIFIGLIPYIGALISFIFLGCARGTVGRNLYGNDPT